MNANQMDAKQEHEALASVGEWEDPDENEGHWPYPNQYRRSAPSEHLRAAIIARVGAPADARVTLLTTTISGGWSSWTQETDYDLTVEVNDDEVFSSDSHWDEIHGLNALLAWLDGASGDPR